MKQFKTLQIVVLGVILLIGLSQAQFETENNEQESEPEQQTSLSLFGNSQQLIGGKKYKKKCYTIRSSSKSRNEAYQYIKSKSKEMVHYLQNAVMIPDDDFAIESKVAQRYLERKRYWVFERSIMLYGPEDQLKSAKEKAQVIGFKQTTCRKSFNFYSPGLWKRMNILIAYHNALTTLQPSLLIEDFYVKSFKIEQRTEVEVQLTKLITDCIEQLDEDSDSENQQAYGLQDSAAAAEVRHNSNKPQRFKAPLISVSVELRSKLYNRYHRKDPSSNEDL